MSKIINLVQDSNMPQSELTPNEAKYLDLTLNRVKLVSLDGGHELFFAANVEQKKYGVSYGVLVKDTVTEEVIGRLDSPMIVMIVKGVYDLHDESGKLIRVVCFSPDLRSEIEE